MDNLKYLFSGVSFEIEDDEIAKYAYYVISELDRSYVIDPELSNFIHEIRRAVHSRGGHTISENTLRAVESLFIKSSYNDEISNEILQIAKEWYLTVSHQVIKQLLGQTTFTLNEMFTPQWEFVTLSGKMLKASAKFKDSPHNVSLIPIVSGYGFVGLFANLGVNDMIITDVQMCPSVSEILNVINSQMTEKIILLPNHSNATFAAQQVAKMSSKEIEVILTETIPQGINAILDYNPQESVSENITKMYASAQNVFTIEFKKSPLRMLFNGDFINKNDPVCFVNNHVFKADKSWDSLLGSTLESLCFPKNAMVNIFRGGDFDSSQTRTDKLVNQLTSMGLNLSLNALPSGMVHSEFILSYNVE